jgi:hypothetical protein
MVSQPQQPFRSERLDIQIELMTRIRSFVPAEGDLAAVWGKRRRNLLSGQARKGNHLSAEGRARW